MRNFRQQKLAFILALCLLFLPYIPGQAALPQQEGSPETRAQDLLAQLTPEERVGQLFLATFQGPEAGVETQIYDLISSHYLGGVILNQGNDNFTVEQTAENIHDLITQLQNSRYSSSQTEHTDPISMEAFLPAYIPLFVGIAQEGDGAPRSQIHSGTTQLPSQLAIGATWNLDLARQIGALAGRELGALGFNLLFGPSLDVSDIPNPDGEGDLNVRVFGGDPYWVGEMARAYIAGVHEGSQGKMAVVGTHFPGLGSADRLPEYEIATVRKSLEQLQQIELAPFFSVTGNAEDTTERLDALLVSHIRYQGLQGNIRSTTRPVSFDQPALNLLMQLDPISGWRDAGGIMISDDLGSRAVRRFHDPTEQTFNASRLALDAFLAGNDILYLNNFVSSDDPDAYTTILGTLEFFAQRYRADPVFAQRVDESVLRILTLKFQLYGFFTPNLVLPQGDIAEINTTESKRITYEVAQRAATLLSPPLDELDNVIPNTPNRSDQIVFITDTYDSQQCSTCPIEPVLLPDALQQSVINLFGPVAGNLITPTNLNSITFAQLANMLDSGDEAQLIENSIGRANWLVFTMLNIDLSRPESLALQRFLAERPDLSSNKKVIVFAANAPYYLDATDISKLTAYFSLYGKTTAFMNVAARLLFKEISNPEGALPVSVPGIGYDLITATSPNPAHSIPLRVDTQPFLVGDPGFQATPVSRHQLGDIIRLETGVILDHNGNRVPDNTPVQFTITINGQEMPPISVMTQSGITATDYQFIQSGFVNIKAISGSASSVEIVFEIPVPEGPTVTATEAPTATPEPSPTATQPPPTPLPTPMPETPSTSSQVRNWIFALAIIFAIAWGASRSGAARGQVRLGVRWGFAAIISGLLTYTYGTLALPGSAWVTEGTYPWGLLLLAFFGALFGWGAMAIFFNDQRK